MDGSLPEKRMTVPEYLAWAEGATAGRYELFRGEVVEMAPERARHNLLKGAAFIALRDAIKRSGVQAVAYTDGMTVVIDDHTAREPDALVQLTPIDLDSLISDAPVIVVEVASSSSEGSDITTKFAEYFSIATIEHYLIVDLNDRVIHHQRQPDGDILTRVIAEGDITLDPPGLVIPYAELVPKLD
jgi:Uma2 family endonuclease